MKRFKNLISEIIADENLESSFKYVLRGKRKQTRTGQYLITNKEVVLSKIKIIISSGNFRLDNYKEFTIQERDKTRTIQCVPLMARIILHAMMTVVEKYVNRTYISTSAASIKGKGGLYLHKKLKNDLKYNPEYHYIYKCDIKKFYENIDQNLMMHVLRKTFNDEILLKLLNVCVTMLPKGLSIGLRSSQCLANLYLSYYLDHVVKDKYGIKFYYRYCDDIVICCNSLNQVTYIKSIILSCLTGAKLTIKPNEQCWDLYNRPIDFLGFILYSNGMVKIRKHIKQRFAKRWKRVISNDRKIKLIGSFYGISKHANCGNLFKKLTGMEIKNFSELGLVYEDHSGKKQFEGQVVSLGTLLNLSVVILDFESDVNTKFGNDRYLVSYELNGVTNKFFTNSKELKQLLDKAKTGNLLPFRTTISRKNIGNGFKYIFT